jgi:very-short-patch-repair endonuclease
LNLPEFVLWKQLQRRQLAGLHFRRQHPIGPYVLDFFCASARLAVEVDGMVHADAAQRVKDRVRDRWLGDRRIRVLRISAAEILDADSVAGALRRVAQACTLAKSSPALAGEGDPEGVEGADRSARTLPRPLHRYAVPLPRRSATGED